MPTTTSPLVTLDEVKCHLPIRKGNVDFDDRLRSLILLATTQIEQATKRNFTEQEFFAAFSARSNTRRVLDLIGDDRATMQALSDDFHTGGTSQVTRTTTLTLPSFPVDEGQTFEVIYDPFGAFSGNQTFVVINATSYTLDADKGILYLRFPTVRGRRRLRVQFTGGFPATGDTGFETLVAAPDDLKLACTFQTIYLFKKMDRENLGSKENKKAGGTNVRFQGASGFMKGSGLTPEASSLLTVYKALLKGSS